MTDEMQSTVVTKKKRSLVLPIAAGVIAIAALGFIASRAGLDKALVKQQLDEFIVQVKERAAAQGRDINISYGDLEVVGSFASKHVVVHDPVLTVKPLDRQPQESGATNKKVDALKVTTPSLAIYPQAADLSSLRIEAGEPINFAAEQEPEKSLLKITGNVPIIVSVAQKKVNGTSYNEIDYQAPSQMNFTYLREQQGQGEEEKTPTIVPVYETLQLAMAQGSGVTSNVAADKSGLGSVNVNFRDIVLTPESAPEGALKIAEITGSWNNVLNEKKLNKVSALFKFGPITSDNPAAPYLPIALDLDATYEGAMLKTPEAIAANPSPESSMVLKNFNLTSKDASLKATANFVANSADVLPVGTASVALTNAPLVLGELRKYGILAGQNDALVSTVLQTVTGQPVDQLKDVVIPIERARGGAFKIGKTTFEELFAVFLKQALQSKSGQAPAVPVIDGQQQPAQPPLVPQLPPADKPKSAPIEVPDHGVRG